MDRRQFFRATAGCSGIVVGGQCAVISSPRRLHHDWPFHDLLGGAERKAPSSARVHRLLVTAEEDPCTAHPRSWEPDDEEAVASGEGVAERIERRAALG
jgi:hypothetical protein